MKHTLHSKPAQCYVVCEQEVGVERDNTNVKGIAICVMGDIKWNALKFCTARHDSKCIVAQQQTNIYYNDVEYLHI